MREYWVIDTQTNEYFRLFEHRHLFDGDWKQQTPFAHRDYIDLDIQKIDPHCTLGEHVFYAYDLCPDGMIANIYYDKDKVGTEEARAFGEQLESQQDMASLGYRPLEQTKGRKANVYAVSNCLAAGNTDSEYYAQSKEALHESKIFKATAIIFTFAKSRMYEYIPEDNLPDVLDEAVNKCLAVDNTNAEDMLETQMFAPLKNLMSAKKENALRQVFDLLQSEENPGEKMREVATLVCDDLHQHLQKQSQSAEFDDNDAYCMAPGR